jgi:large subunit ribosomal protein L35
VPKMKTHRGAADRFAVTKRGKLLRGHAKLNHLLSKKSSRQKRRLGRMSIVAEGDRRSVRRLLGR